MELSPTYIDEIEEGLHHYMKKYLLKHSKKLDGILLCYKIFGVEKTFGISNIDGSLILKCSIEFLVMKINKGRVKLNDNMVLGVFKAEKEVESDLNNNMEINKENEEEDDGKNEKFNDNLLLEEYKTENIAKTDYMDIKEIIIDENFFVTVKGKLI